MLSLIFVDGNNSRYFFFFFFYRLLVPIESISFSSSFISSDSSLEIVIKVTVNDSKYHGDISTENVAYFL